jgi:hypothetical protein
MSSFASNLRAIATTILHYTPLQLYSWPRQKRAILTREPFKTAYMTCVSQFLLSGWRKQLLKTRNYAICCIEYEIFREGALTVWHTSEHHITNGELTQCQVEMRRSAIYGNWILDMQCWPYVERRKFRLVCWAKFLTHDPSEGLVRNGVLRPLPKFCEKKRDNWPVLNSNRRFRIP